MHTTAASHAREPAWHRMEKEHFGMNACIYTLLLDSWTRSGVVVTNACTYSDLQSVKVSCHRELFMLPHLFVQQAQEVSTEPSAMKAFYQDMPMVSLQQQAALQTLFQLMHSKGGCTTACYLLQGAALMEACKLQPAGSHLTGCSHWVLGL